jgi:hypothetical protein
MDARREVHLPEAEAPGAIRQVLEERERRMVDVALVVPAYERDRPAPCGERLAAKAALPVRVADCERLGALG